MKTLADTRRLTLARRLACDLPVWAVARASNMSSEALEAVMLERGFEELVSSMADLMAMDEEARLAKLYRIAQQVMAAAVTRLDERACEFMIRQTQLKRNPHKTLQRGLNRTIRAEIAKGAKVQAEVDAGQLTPETPLPEPPPPPFDFSKQPKTLAEAIAACEAAAALPEGRPVDHLDTRLYRTAGSLRREMLREEVIFHAVAEHEAALRRNVPLELDEVEAIEVGQVVEGARRKAEGEAEAAPTPPLPDTKAPPDAEPELSPADVKALDEIRAMYRRFPPERLAAMCQRPPKGMEKLFAVLAREIGIEAKPQGP